MPGRGKGRRSGKAGRKGGKGKGKGKSTKKSSATKAKKVRAAPKVAIKKPIELDTCEDSSTAARVYSKEVKLILEELAHKLAITATQKGKERVATTLEIEQLVEALIQAQGGDVLWGFDEDSHGDSGTAHKSASASGITSVSKHMDAMSDDSLLKTVDMDTTTPVTTEQSADSTSAISLTTDGTKDDAKMKEIESVESEKILDEKSGLHDFGVELSAERRKEEAALKALGSWLLSLCPECGYGSTFTFAGGLKEGRGVVALCDLDAGSRVMIIPRTAMLSSADAKSRAQPSLRAFISSDRLCAKVPSLALALLVWSERLAGGNSFWSAYLDALPTAFHLPHECPLSEFLPLLSGTALLDQIIDMKLNHLKHYTYLRAMLSRASVSVLCADGSKRGLRFVDYLWAVGVVMTRQNSIPAIDDGGDGGEDQSEMALIPGWDMCNYAPGVVSTYFDKGAQRNVMLLMNARRGGEQIFMYYGSQRNEELFLNSGFVMDENTNDRVEIQVSLGSVCAKDPLLKVKQLQLTRVGFANDVMRAQMKPPQFVEQTTGPKPDDAVDFEERVTVQKAEETFAQLLASVKRAEAQLAASKMEDLDIDAIDATVENVRRLKYLLKLDFSEDLLVFCRICVLTKTEMATVMRRAPEECLRMVSLFNEKIAFKYLLKTVENMVAFMRSKLRQFTAKATGFPQIALARKLLSVQLANLRRVHSRLLRAVALIQATMDAQTEAQKHREEEAASARIQDELHRPDLDI